MQHDQFKNGAKTIPRGAEPTTTLLIPFKMAHTWQETVNTKSEIFAS